MIKRNFFRKMLFFYMGIILLYTTILSFITYNKGVEFAKMENHHSSRRYVEQVGSYIDYKLQTALGLISTISTEESFIDYRYSEAVDYYLITKVFNEITSLLRTSGFHYAGIDLGITRSSDDIIITSEGTLNYEHFLREIEMNADAFYEFMDSELASRSEFTYVFPASAIESSNKMVILHKMKGSFKVEPAYFFLILNTDLFLTGGEEQGDFSLYTEEAIINLTSTAEVFDTQEAAVSDEFIHYVQPSGTIADLKYVYSIKPIAWFSIIVDILWPSLLPVILLMIFGTWLSFKAANSSYKPIRALVNFINNQGSMREGTQETAPASDLDYIQSNIEYIYNRNHILQSNLDQSFIRLQEDFFRKIIYGIADEVFIKENVSALKLEGYDETLRMFLLECEGTKHISYHNFSVLIYEIIEKYNQLTEPFFILPLDNQKYCIITKKESDNTLTNLGKYIMDSLSLHLSLDVVVCLSGEYSLENLSNGLQELLVLNNYKYTFVDQRILTLDTIKENKEHTYLYPLETETCLIHYISNNEYEKGKNLLAQLIDKNLKECPLSPTNIIQLKYSLITTFKRSLNRDGMSLNQFIKEYPMAVEKFLEIPVNNLKEGCLSLYDIIFKYCSQDKFSLENSTASKIFIYIQQNFDKDISLTEIAKYFELSESYISKLLKSYLDVNFKTYVNKLKIKKAKELLTKGGCKINDIAVMVGCNNTNTFIRVFKQYEGVSPGEYMKNLK